uniref:MULE transposase domain-containing protein n=1 Tax=Plectus sambesii TaxID=2011161 RepID=A0A914VEA6_9BILA
MFTLSKGTTKFGHDLLACRINDKVITFSVKDRPKGQYTRYSCVSCKTIVRKKLANASTTYRVIRVRHGTSISIDDPSIDARSGTAAAPFAIAAEHLSRLPERVEQEQALFPENTAPLQAVNAACSDPDILSRRLRKGKSSTKNALKMRNKFDVPSAYKKTLCNQDYLIHRDEDLGMMLFGSPEAVQRLQESEEWKMDGTFDRCPDQFQQLYTVFGSVKGGESIALLHAVLTKSTISSYEALLTNIILNCAQFGELKVKRILTDFEDATISAVRRVLHNRFSNLDIQLSGCLFHWASCLRRNSCLTRARKKVKEIDQWYQLIRGLPLLPIDLIKKTWSEDLRKYPTTRRCKPYIKAMKKFVQYFERNWLKNDETIAHWNHFDHSGARTTNVCEGYHSKVKWMLPRSPSVTDFLEYLRKLHNLTNVCEGYHSKVKWMLPRSPSVTDFLEYLRKLHNLDLIRLAQLYHRNSPAKPRLRKKKYVQIDEQLQEAKVRFLTNYSDSPEGEKFEIVRKHLRHVALLLGCKNQHKQSLRVLLPQNTSSSLPNPVLSPPILPPIPLDGLLEHLRDDYDEPIEDRQIEIEDIADEAAENDPSHEEQIENEDIVEETAEDEPSHQEQIVVVDIADEAAENDPSHEEQIANEDIVDETAEDEPSHEEQIKDHEFWVRRSAVADRHRKLLPLLQIATSEECMEHLLSILNETKPCKRVTDFLKGKPCSDGCNPLSTDDQHMSTLIELLINRLEVEFKKRQVKRTGAHTFNFAMYVWAPEAVKYALMKYYYMNEEEAEKIITEMPKMLPHEHEEVREQMMTTRYSENAFD